MKPIMKKTRKEAAEITTRDAIAFFMARYDIFQVLISVSCEWFSPFPPSEDRVKYLHLMQEHLSISIKGKKCAIVGLHNYLKFNAF